MYKAPIDAYMLRYEAADLVATPVRLTNVRPDSFPAAVEDLARGRIVFVAPDTLSAIVAADYPAHVRDLTAAMTSRQPCEIRISAAGIAARDLVEAM